MSPLPPMDPAGPGFGPPPRRPAFRPWLAVLALAAAGSLGCQTPRAVPRPAGHLAAEQTRLARALHGLGPPVSTTEAERAARSIVQTVEQARMANRLQGGAIPRNLAVNLGLHDWGLCWHWTELLGRSLQSENLRTLQVHWGCAHAGSTLREHNAVVITARGQTFADGLVVDPWRQGGLLTWIRVGDDRYPWRHEPWSEARWRAVAPDARR